MASPYSSAAGIALDLGTFGGSSLTQQLKDQTDEERKKKQLGLSMMQSPAGQLLAQSPFMKG